VLVGSLKDHVSSELFYAKVYHKRYEHITSCNKQITKKFAVLHGRNSFFSLILYSMFERFLNLTFISRSYMHNFLSLSIAGKQGFDGPGIFMALRVFTANTSPVYSLHTFIAGS
jgi:hypothetical protein